MLFFQDALQLFHDLMHLLQRIESIIIFFIDKMYCCFFVFSPVKRIYIWSTSILIYFITFVIQWMNTIKDKITTSHWCFQSNLISAKKWSKTFFYIIICIVINHEFCVIIFKCITCSSLFFLEEIKIIVIVDWIFYVQDFLRSFMISFKYGLILLRYSSVDTVLFLSPLLSYSIYFLLQN